MPEVSGTHSIGRALKHSTAQRPYPKVLEVQGALEEKRRYECRCRCQGPRHSATPEKKEPPPRQLYNSKPTLRQSD